jgi:hypothetical protein
MKYISCILRATDMRRARAFGNTSREYNTIEIQINSNNVNRNIDENYVCKLMF